MAKTTTLEVYKDKKGAYRFRLVAKNGEPVALASEGYERKQSAMQAAKKLGEWASTAVIVDIEKEEEETRKAKALAKSAPKKEVAKKAPAKKPAPKKATKKSTPEVPASDDAAAE